MKQASALSALVAVVVAAIIGLAISGESAITALASPVITGLLVVVLRQVASLASEVSDVHQVVNSHSDRLADANAALLEVKDVALLKAEDTIAEQQQTIDSAAVEPRREG